VNKTKSSKKSFFITIFTDIFIAIVEKFLIVLIFFTKKYVDFRNDYNWQHLKINLDNQLVSLAFTNHDWYIAEKQGELEQLQKTKLPFSDFILKAIELCHHCNFLIFECNDGVRFIQFWLGDGKIVCHWPIMKTNKLGKYLYAMLGVANELDITHLPHKINKWPKAYDQYYKIRKLKDFDEYEIYFGRDRDKAGKFVELVTTQVFKQKLESLDAWVG